MGRPRGCGDAGTEPWQGSEERPADAARCPGGAGSGGGSGLGCASPSHPNVLGTVAQGAADSTARTGAPLRHPRPRPAFCSVPIVSKLWVPRLMPALYPKHSLRYSSSSALHSQSASSCTLSSSWVCYTSDQETWGFETFVDKTAFFDKCQSSPTGTSVNYCCWGSAQLYSCLLGGKEVRQPEWGCPGSQLSQVRMPTLDPEPP
jgi:hypothetical protein